MEEGNYITKWTWQDKVRCVVLVIIAAAFILGFGYAGEIISEFFGFKGIEIPKRLSDGLIIGALYWVWVLTKSVEKLEKRAEKLQDRIFVLENKRPN